MLKPNIHVKDPQTDVLEAIVGVIEKFPFVPLLPLTTVRGIVLLTQFYFSTVRRASLEQTPAASFQPVGQEVQALAAEEVQVLHL